MTLKWIDTEDIAEALNDAFPDINVLSIRFTDLWQWVQSLKDFSDSPEKCNEKILEAIQAEWIKIKS
ncbi:MAG: Fe-S assembly protein IscX [Candidatus Puniceispirillum sp.]|nr:Fe-S assembly protein IscX [Candidatus Pelagibacter sp.]MBA4283206.1 Fe-S assembly protein IscX [Candidatus Puniceispirillum sp.]